jgi:hypothetical protein
MTRMPEAALEGRVVLALSRLNVPEALRRVPDDAADVAGALVPWIRMSVLVRRR